jgi:hypothetical protein
MVDSNDRAMIWIVNEAADNSWAASDHLRLAPLLASEINISYKVGVGYERFTHRGVADGC